MCVFFKTFACKFKFVQEHSFLMLLILFFREAMRLHLAPTRIPPILIQGPEIADHDWCSHLIPITLREDTAETENT
jgi:hypothetical protein